MKRSSICPRDCVKHICIGSNGLGNIEMITRSAARAQTELSRTTERQKRIDRKQRLALREEIQTPYNLRSTMGKKGGNSSKGTGVEPKGVARTVGRDDVSPRNLMTCYEDGTPIKQPVRKV